MSRVVRLIHERQSIWPTPSCLSISARQISRSYKSLIMFYSIHIGLSEMLTSSAFSMKISVSSRICCGPNAGFYQIIRHLTTNITQRNWPRSSAIVVFDNGSMNKSSKNNNFTWFLWISPSTARSPLYSHIVVDENMHQKAHQVQRVYGKRNWVHLV